MVERGAWVKNRVHATKNKRKVGGHDGETGSFCARVHIRTEPGVSLQEALADGGRGEGRKGGRLRSSGLYHYVEVDMPVPGAKITHHVSVYRWGSLGFVSLSLGTGGAGSRSQERSLWGTNERSCLARSARRVLYLERNCARDETSREVGQKSQMERKRRVEKRGGKEKGGYYWGRALDKDPEPSLLLSRPVEEGRRETL